MKQLLFFIIGCLFSPSIQGQTTKKKQVVQTIIQERQIYLNGGARSSVGGKSRTIIPIKLPEGTTSWYYSFTTSPGESGTKNLNLFAQLSTLALDPTGITEEMVSKIQIPEGSASIDVYLLDQPNSDLFIQKVDNEGGKFSSFREGLVTNTRQALVSIYSPKEGTFYLGLKNPSTWDGINIQIEVVAVTEITEEQTEEESEAITLGNLGWKAFERGDYGKCIDLSKKALELDNSLGYVYFNLGISYLMKGQNEEAISAYTKAIAVTKKSSIPAETFEGAIDDLNTYMDKFPSKDDAQDILDILTEEASHY